MSRAVTVSPVYQEGPNGEQAVVDFSFDSQEPYDSSNERYGGNVNDVYEDEYGNTHHLFEDVELQEEDEGSYNNDEHEEAILDAYPDLSYALEWAAQNPGVIDIDQYNECMDSDDHSVMYEQIEHLLDVFYEYGDFEEIDSQIDKDVPPIEEFVGDIYEKFGGKEQYDGLTDWAAQNLDQETIDKYDAIMTSENPMMIANAINWLLEYYQENNY